MPPSYVAPSGPLNEAITPRFCNRPRPQPLKIKGNVSQLGTFSFQPSITAATTMAAQMNRRGQLLRVNNAITEKSSHTRTTGSIGHFFVTSRASAFCESIGPYVQRRAEPGAPRLADDNGASAGCNTSARCRRCQ